MVNKTVSKVIQAIFPIVAACTVIYFWTSLMSWCGVYKFGHSNPIELFGFVSLIQVIA